MGRAEKIKNQRKITMTDIYKDDGWLVVVSLPQVGTKHPYRLWAVAEKDESIARVTIQPNLSEGEKISALSPLSSLIMETLQLSPGEFSEWKTYER